MYSLQTRKVFKIEYTNEGILTISLGKTMEMKIMAFILKNVIPLWRLKISRCNYSSNPKDTMVALICKAQLAQINTTISHNRIWDLSRRWAHARLYRLRMNNSWEEGQTSIIVNFKKIQLIKDSMWAIWNNLSLMKMLYRHHLNLKSQSHTVLHLLLIEG